MNVDECIFSAWITQIKLSRHAGYCWISEDELIGNIVPVLDDQEHTYNSYGPGV